jgi:NAD+ kinase
MRETQDKGKVLLFVNSKKDGAERLAQEIEAGLDARGYGTERYQGGPLEKGCFSLAFSLGGDGTVLSSSRIAAPLGIPLIAINLGAVGFLAAVEPEKWEAAFDELIEGGGTVSRRIMVEAAVRRQEAAVYRGFFLNEAVVGAGGMAKLLNFCVHFEGEDFDYRADGVIVSTPTGSSAYSAAAGGPLLDPGLGALLVNPVCPYSLAARPFVIPLPANDTSFYIKLSPEQRLQEGRSNAAVLTLDGQETFPMEAEDVLTLRRAPFDALFQGNISHEFYSAVKYKLFRSFTGA